MAHVELPTAPLTGYQDLALTQTTPVRLSPPAEKLPTDADPTYRPPTAQALVQVQRAPVRVRFDGGTPTTTSGFVLAVGDVVLLQLDVILAARWVADTNTAATLSISYFQ